MRLALHCYPYEGTHSNRARGCWQDEIVRVVDALQLSAKHSVATPANWPNNHDSINKKGWAFLLPTVTPEDAEKHFPGYHACKVVPLLYQPPQRVPCSCSCFAA